MKKYILSLAIVSLIIGTSVSASWFSNLFSKNQVDETLLSGTILKVPAGGTGASTFTVGECLIGNGTGAITSAACSSGGGSGTVTSVGMIVPTGLSVSTALGTTAATSTITYTSGYSIPLTASTTEGSTAYTWGNHAVAGYLLTANAFTQAIASTTFADKNLYVSNANYYATTTHANISSLPALSITKSQVSDFGTYENALTFNYPLSRATNAISLSDMATSSPTNGTGISLSGTGSVVGGSLQITNSAPDQTVVLSNGTGINVTGTYPNFTITNSLPQTFSYPFPSNATTTPLTFTGLFTTTNATSTAFSSSYASSTLGYFGTAYIPNLGTAVGSFIAVNATGQIIATSTPGGGSVSSVANSDGTLTISPTTGSVVASLALGHANTWSGAQTFTSTTTLGAVNINSGGLTTINGTLNLATTTAGILNITSGGLVYSAPQTNASITLSGAVSGTGTTAITTSFGTLAKGNFYVGNDSNIGQATSTIFITPTGNVGIGTTAPGALTHIYQTGTSLSTPTLYVQDFSLTPAAGKELVKIQGRDNAGDSLLFHVLGNNGTIEAMAIEDDGNVGIGTTAPGNKLEVIGNIAAYSGAITTWNTAVLGATGNGAGWLDLKYDTATKVHISSGSASGATYFMDSNVGIGTASPTDKLHVNGNMSFVGQNPATISFGSAGAGGTGGDYIRFGDQAAGNPLFAIVQDASTKFYVEGSTGNVGIGTTTPWKKFSVDGTVSLKNLSTDSTVGLTGAICLDANNELKLMSGAGTCVTSSEDYKKNIQPLTSGLDWVMRMNPILFDYKDNNKPSLGFTAEEMDLISPLLTAHKVIQTIVPTTKVSTITKEKPCEKQTIASTTEMCPYEKTATSTTEEIINTQTTIPYTVRYELLPAVLVKAIQELKNQIDGKSLGSINSQGDYVSEAVKTEISNQINAIDFKIKIIQVMKEMSFWEKIKLLLGF